MITTLSALLASKYGKYVLAVLIVAGLVGGAYLWAEHHGRDEQKADDDQKQTQEIEKSRQEAQTAKDQLVQHANADAAAADARAKIAEDNFNAAATLLQGIAGKQQAGNDRVKDLPDSQLHSDVVSQLKLRSPGDVTACYTPVEERAIDDAITQWPLCRQQAQGLAQQVKAEQDSTAAAADKVADRDQVIAALNVYIQQLQGDYKELHDQNPPRYRAAPCLWLWKCGKKQVNFSGVPAAGVNK